MVRQYSNTAIETTLTLSILPTDTSIVVASASGFPNTFPYRLTVDFEAPASEIVDVTAASGTTLTVLRGADGTSAQSHSPGAPVVHTATAQDFRDIQDHVAAPTAVHGLVSGAAVVGTSSTQTLTNKTIDGIANTLLNIDAGAVSGNFKSTVIVASNSTSVALQVKGFTGQTANLQNWTDSAGAVLASIDKDGNAHVDSLSTTDGGITTGSAGTSVFNGSLSGSFSGTLNASAGTFTGQSASLTSPAAGTTPLKVKLAPAATADAIQVLSSTDALLFNVSASGAIGTAAGVTAATKSTLTQAVVKQTGTTDPVLQLKAETAVANTKPYLQITNHSDVVIASIDSLGYVVSPGDITSLALNSGCGSNAGATQVVNYIIGSEEYDARDRHQNAAAPYGVTKITFSTAGYWLLIHSINYSANATGQRGSEIHLNGTATMIGHGQRVTAVNGFVTSTGASVAYKFAAGDYIEHHAYQNSGATLAACDFRLQAIFLGI